MRVDCLIIKRYFGKELIKTALAVTLVLCFVFLCNQFIRLLTRAAAGKLGAGALFKIISIQIPYLLGLLMPVGLYLAILLVFGRLYVDHEVTVLRACGVGKWQFLRYIQPIVWLIAAMVGVMTLYVNPQLIALQTQLMQASPSKLLIETLQPGRFHVANDGQQVYYVEKIDRDTDSAKQVFMAKMDKREMSGADAKIPEGWTVLSASRGTQEAGSDGQDYIVAEDGYRYHGTPGQAEFQMVKFARLATFIDTDIDAQVFEQAGMSNQELWELRATDLRAVAELQWRIAIPLSVPVLAFLALPLSRVRPRQGRYGPLLPAIIIYVIFANFMFVSRSWIESGRLSPILGLWWILLGALVLGFFLQIDWHAWRVLRYRLKREVPA